MTVHPSSLESDMDAT